MLDSAEFNARLFFPRPATSPPPPGATDFYAGDWHVRRHALLSSAPTLLLFHGNGEVVSDYDGTAAQFAEAGVNLTVADFPGYGASRGVPTLRRLIEEAHAVADAVEPDVVMGRSLGSACANAIIGLGGTERFILESGFVDLKGLVRRRGLAPPAAFSARQLAVFDPLPKLRRARGPLLVLHGREDEAISPSEAEAAYAAAGSVEKRLVLIDGRGHNDVSLSPQYWAAVAAIGAPRS
jgi:pimeloyl-ACP methyl ester carboxylesterase